MSAARRPRGRDVGRDARSVAAAVLDRLEASRAPAGDLVERRAAGLDERDRRLARELVSGVLRWRRRLDQVLAAAGGRPPERIQRELLAPLRIGAYQLLFLSRVPAHAAVDRAVEEARRRTHPGGAGFVNAVLRRVAAAPDPAAWPVAERDPRRRLAVEASHPDFLVFRWLERWGEERTRRLLEANNTPRPMHLLAFRARGGREALAARLAAERVATGPSALAPQGLVVRRGDPLAGDSFRRGELYLQDEAGQAAALLPPPRPGERVLDAAAAPGGKGLALAAYEPSVSVTAADASLGRLRLLAANLERLRLVWPLLAADAGHPPLPAVFDRVVLDLPCTGTGTLRKHPELKWRVSAGELRRLARHGLRLLTGAAAAVRPGGLLAVITCSLEPEENEQVVEAFVAGHQGFALQALDEGPDGEWRTHLETPHRWRVLPAGDHDGYTVSLLRRRA